MSANIDRRTFLAGTTAGSLVLLSLGGCNKLVQRSLQRNQQIAQGSFALSARTSDDSCSGNCVSDLRKTRRLRLRARIRSCLLSAVPGRPVRSCLPDRCSTSRPEDRYRDDGSAASAASTALPLVLTTFDTSTRKQKWRTTATFA